LQALQRKENIKKAESKYVFRCIGGYRAMGATT
jgi:hypothetical protein